MLGVPGPATSTDVAAREAAHEGHQHEGHQQASALHRGEPLVSFNITTTNIGSVAASDAVLVFVAPTDKGISAAAPRPLPNKQLVAFVRTPVLRPGTSLATLSSTLARHLSPSAVAVATSCILHTHTAANDVCVCVRACVRACVCTCICTCVPPE